MGHTFAPDQGMLLCFLALLCPPMATAIVKGCDKAILISLALWLAGGLPGIFHAWYLICKAMQTPHRAGDVESGAAAGHGGCGCAVHHHYHHGTAVPARTQAPGPSAAMTVYRPTPAAHTGRDQYRRDDGPASPVIVQMHEERGSPAKNPFEAPPYDADHKQGFPSKA